MSRTVGLILAGGRSLRFGGEKAVAVLDGLPLLAHAHAALAGLCEAVAVSAAPGSGAERLATQMGLPVLHDDPAHPRGPLAGVARGLAWAEGLSADRLALIPCDTPRVSTAVMQRLAAALQPGDGVAAAQTTDGLHALCAVLRVDAGVALTEALDRGEHPPVRAAWEAMGLRTVSFDDPSALLNVNRPDDLARLGRK